MKMLNNLKNLFFPRPRLIGIDVGTQSVRLIELSKRANNYKLEGSALIPFDDPTEKNIVVAIKLALKTAKVKTNKVAFALAHSAIIYKELTVAPDLSEKELEAFLEFNLEKYIGQPAANISMDYQVNKQQVKLITVRRERVEKCLELAKQSDLELKIIDIDSHALLRAVSPQLTNIQEPVAVINIDFGAILLCIIKNGNLLYAHTDIIDNLQLCLSSLAEPPRYLFLTGEKTLDQNIIQDLEKHFINLQYKSNIPTSMLIAYGLAMRGDYAKY